ncbi:hypothetical protein ACHAWO_001629 [Cyclotella atomus]|uniref:Uncharacterized protein n=1 Tax=Cyclotella atomus TaxID=382360 RepID=A0ABD3PA99_9STRA
MVLLESDGPKPKELSVEAIDVSVSDMTDGASLDRLPHLLGVLPDDHGTYEDEYTIKEEMRFALREPHETVLKQTASLDAEDRSTVSSLTYELYPSFDELHKSYVVRGDLEPKAFNEQKNSIDAEDASVRQSSMDKVSPWKRWFRLSQENSRRADSCIRVLNVSKKTLVIAAVVMLLALIAITASSSAISPSRVSRGYDSIEAADPEDKGGAPDIQTGGYQSKPNETGTITSTRPASKSSKENASLSTAQSSDLGEIGDAIVITSKSGGGVLSHFNSSTHEERFEDDFQPSANSTDSPSYNSIQAPTLTPTNYPTNSIKTEAPVLIHTSLFDTPTYYPSYADIPIETQAPSRAKTYTDEPTMIFTSEPTQYPSLHPSGKPLP